MSAAGSSIHENWVQPRQKPFTKTREREQFTQLRGDNGSLGLVSWLNQNLIGLNEAWSPFTYEPILSSSCNEHGRAGRSRAPEGASFSHHRPRSLISGGILWSPESPSVLGGSQPFAWLNVGFRSSAVCGLQGKSSLAPRCTTFHYENGRSIMCVGRMFAWPHCHFRDSHREIIPLRARACVHDTESRARLSQWNGSHVGVTNMKSYLHIYTSVPHRRGRKTEEKSTFGETGQRMLLDILEQQSFPGLYMILRGYSSKIRTARKYSQGKIEEDPKASLRTRLEHLSSGKTPSSCERVCAQVPSTLSTSCSKDWL